MISKHITYHEATHSNTAVRKGIENKPSKIELENMKLLAEQIFDSSELASFKALPEAEKRLSFYQAWSSKEAHYKLGCNAAAPAAQQFQLSHTSLSIVLCTALPLATEPLLLAPQWAA